MGQRNGRRKMIVAWLGIPERSESRRPEIQNSGLGAISEGDRCGPHIAHL